MLKPQEPGLEGIIWNGLCNLREKVFDISKILFYHCTRNLNLNHWLITNRLRLNVARTESMVIGSNQRIHALSNNQVIIEIGGKSIKGVDEAKSLGLIDQQNITIDEKSKRISSAIGALKHIRPFIF